ncbi:MAG: polyprenyl diphosphate synthase [Candidatus Marinamargulisbacteria bacterium]|nr:polyprenyl diphosphate synthase [Candidatus Marinamargulisbacteria bacterium]
MQSPGHIAVIMDGNRRWASENGHNENDGHRAGSRAFQATIDACIAQNISYLSAYVFSTENWKRPKPQIKFLMTLMEHLLNEHVKTACKNDIRVRCLGNLRVLPESLQSTIAMAHEKTKSHTTLNLNIMINYGAHEEITHACQTIARTVHAGNLDPELITPQTIQDHLHTAHMPSPDILIRTGGKSNIRLSNFMLWQCAYSELFFLPIFWPEFNAEHLNNVLNEYHSRQRNFGE